MSEHFLFLGMFVSLRQTRQMYFHTDIHLIPDFMLSNRSLVVKRTIIFTEHLVGY